MTPRAGETVAGGPRALLEKLLETVVLLLVTTLAVVVVVGVGFRKAGAALVWYDELASIILAWLTYYGAGLAALKHAHIGFPKLVASAPTRLRLALIGLREVFVVGFFLVVAWAGWQVQEAIAGSYLVSMPSIPTRVAHSVIPIGALLFVAAELTVMWDRFRWHTGRGEDRPTTGGFAGGDANGGPAP